MKFSRSNNRISEEVLDRLVENAICREAEQNNIELGRALKGVSEERLRKILAGDTKKRSVKRIVWERLAWSVSVAALIAVAIAVPIAVEHNAKNEICNLVYAYNAPSLKQMTSLTSKSAGNETLPDITEMSDKELEKLLPSLETSFNDAENLQDIYIYGKILALSYIRLHKSKDAANVLESAIKKLETDEDYLTQAVEFEELLIQIR